MVSDTEPVLTRVKAGVSVRKVISRSKFTEQIFPPDTEKMSNVCSNCFPLANSGINHVTPVNF